MGARVNRAPIHLCRSAHRFARATGNYLPQTQQRLTFVKSNNIQQWMAITAGTTSCIVLHFHPSLAKTRRIYQSRATSIISHDGRSTART